VVIGASSGFAHGATLKLASYGSNVVLAARRIRDLKEVAVETRAAGGTPLVGTMDVSKSDKLERLAVGRFGCIDVWINNAAIGAIGWFEDVPLRDYDRVIDINLRSGYGSHTAMRLFRQQDFGTIISVSSEGPSYRRPVI
jgi:NAD(P)-dependent dehydrogenase (short-subunit alcohol dehydrogenase family)